MKKPIASILCFIALASTAVYAEEFQVDRMPAGADVTISGQGGAVVPLNMRVMISSTDSPQTIRLVAAGKQAGAVKVSIYDRTLERVKYVTVKPGTPFLYTLPKLSSIFVLPSAAKGTASSMRLKVDSDKPIAIAR